tara:strand:- start:3983 stop:4591 length:609 start_codon:yes stop_codon:yes gene_type:complete
MFKRIGKAANIGKEIGKTAMSKDGREKMKAQLKKTGKRVAGNLGVLKKAACNSAQTKKNLESIKHLQEAIVTIAEKGAGALKEKKSMFGKVTQAGFQPVAAEIDCAAIEKKIQEGSIADAYRTGAHSVGAKGVSEELAEGGLTEIADSVDNLTGVNRSRLGGKTRRGRRRKRRKSRKKRRKSRKKRRKSRRKRKRSRRRRRR